MQRRNFLTLLGTSAAAWPLRAAAQQAGVPVIGYLHGQSRTRQAILLSAFHQGLSETGYVEGRNLAIEYRWAESQLDRLPAFAADLVRRQVTVIASPGTTGATLAAKAATTTIPIVFQTAADPVALGLVASLNRPGGNLTGVTSLNNELGPKLLQVLHELVPAAPTVAVLVNPINPITEALLRDVQAAARTLRLQLHVLHASTERDIDTAFATLVQLRAGGLVIGADALFDLLSEKLAELTIRHAVPAISPYHQFPAAGGLMSYGGDTFDLHRVVGNYTGRILKGERPADLPVQQITKIELTINLKTARTFGFTFPTALLVRADKIIE
jgi:putative ABC transport system substrate-binding protein